MCKGLAPMSIWRGDRFEQFIIWQPTCQKRALRRVLNLSAFVMGFASYPEYLEEVRDCST